uniref:Putative secreted protein n=1 Tax=Xenopsylla cheopis TaxID=163159 RepID=A0A6M2DYW1_XENCH
MFLTWQLKLILLSIVTPKYLTLPFHSISSSPIFTLAFFLFILVPFVRRIASVLELLIFNFHLFVYSARTSR